MHGKHPHLILTGDPVAVLIPAKNTIRPQLRAIHMLKCTKL